MSIASVILEQLGGRRFIVMTGAKNLFAVDGNALSFQLPGKGFAREGINHVWVELSADDTYKISFGRFWGTRYKVLKTLTGVYCDQLRDVFTDVTGLETSL